MGTNEGNPLIIDYLTHCKYEKGLDSKTLKAYKIDLSQFDSYIVDISGTYNKESLQAYIANLHAKYSVKTVKRKIATLKAFFQLSRIRGKNHHQSFFQNPSKTAGTAYPPTYYPSWYNQYAV